MNNGTMNIFVQVFFEQPNSVVLGIYPRIELLGRGSLKEQSRQDVWIHIHKETCFKELVHMIVEAWQVPYLIGVVNRLRIQERAAVQVQRQASWRTRTS